MKPSNSPLDTSSQYTENRPRKFAARACLVISLSVHIVTIMAVLLVSTQQKYGPTVTYIDINSIADSGPPPAAPVIHSPAPQPEIAKTEEPVPLPENIPESTTSETPPAQDEQIVQEVKTTPLGRGMTSGYFSSFAEGKNLRDEIREYYFVLLEQINSKWWLKAETLRETATNDGVVMFLIGRDGTLLEAKLIKGTGSREVDRAIIEVLKDSSPFPPLPASYPLAGFRAPLRMAAPLHLFSVRSLR